MVVRLYKAVVGVIVASASRPDDAISAIQESFALNSHPEKAKDKKGKNEEEWPWGKKEEKASAPKANKNEVTYVNKMEANLDKAKQAGKTGLASWDIPTMEAAAQNAITGSFGSLGTLNDTMKTIIHHHYGLMDGKMAKAIDELEATIKDFRQAKKELQTDTGIVARTAKAAKKHLTEWWKDTEEAELREKEIRKKVTEATAAGQADSIMSTFKAKKPEDVMTVVKDQYGKWLDTADEEYIFFGEKLQYFWKLITVDGNKDRILLKSWIYLQQGLFLSAFRSIFSSERSGSQGQISHGIDIEQLEEILLATTRVISKKLNIDRTFGSRPNPHVFIEKLDDVIVQAVRDRANDDTLGLKQFWQAILKFLLQDNRPAKVDIVINQLEAAMKPSELKLWKAAGLRPEVQKLKKTLDLGEKTSKKFDLVIGPKLNKFLDKLVPKPALERKVKIALQALANQQYVTAVRILLKNDDRSGGLSDIQLGEMIEMVIKAAEIKLSNPGLSTEIRRLLETVKPKEGNAGKIAKLRQFANDEGQLDIEDFAKKLIATVIPAENMQMMANMFLDKFSNELPSTAEFKEYMPLENPKPEIPDAQLGDTQEIEEEAEKLAAEMETTAVEEAAAEAPAANQEGVPNAME